MDTHCVTGHDPGADDRVCHQFHVTADCEPGLLPRLLGLFAKRSIVLEALRAERSRAGNADDVVMIELCLPPVPGSSARHLAACLRQTVGVRSVLGPLAAGSVAGGVTRTRHPAIAL